MLRSNQGKNKKTKKKKQKQRGGGSAGPGYVRFGSGGHSPSGGGGVEAGKGKETYPRQGTLPGMSPLRDDSGDPVEDAQPHSHASVTPQQQEGPAAQQMQEEPGPYDALFDHYDVAFERGDWQEAESVARELITLSTALAKNLMSSSRMSHSEKAETATSIAAAGCHAWKMLANVLQEQSRHAEALGVAKVSTKAARASGSSMLLAMALRCEAHFAREAADEQDAAAAHAAAAAYALSCLEEGIGLTEAAASKAWKQGEAQNAEIYDWQHASLRVDRALLQLDQQPPQQQDDEDTREEQGPVSAASADLQVAEPLLQAYAALNLRSADELQSDPVSSLVRWWNAKARLCLKRGDKDGARSAGQEMLSLARRIERQMLAVSRRRRRSTLLGALEQFARLQAEIGDGEAAQAALQEVRVLRLKL